MAGKISFQGIGSGIDGAAVAKSIADQILLPNKVRESQVGRLQSENTALGSLRSLLASVASSLEGLRTSNGGSGAKSASSSNTQVLTAVAGSNAQLANTSVTVSSLAKSASGSIGNSFDSASSFVLTDGSQSGTLTFTTGTGDDEQTFSVTVDELTTAEDLASKINQASNGTLNAQLVNKGTQGDPQFTVAFSTTTAGVSKGSLSVTSSSQALSDALGGASVSQATNAKFTISGVAGEFERESNTISDVLAGVTLKLQDVGTATVSVKDDASLSAKQVEEFVNAFNAFVRFAQKEDAVTTTQQNGERVNIYGSLAQSNVDDSALADIRSQISQARSSDESLSLASLGITTARDGTLAFDQDVFEQTYASNPGKAQEVITGLADSVAGVEGVVYQYTGYARGIDNALEANADEISNINDAMARTERTASSREDSVLKQFTELERLFAKLNADTGFISSLLGVK